jgi:iron complex transport system permease protein
MPRLTKRASVPIRSDAPTSENISIEDEQDNVYAQAVDEGHRVDPRAQKIFILVIVLIAIYFVGLIFPKNILNVALQSGGYNSGYTFSQFVEDLMANINGLIGVFTGNDTGVTPFSITMIRYIIVALTGAGLALCGAVYQGSFRNALVSPSTLGVMSGATLGMMVWVVFFVDDDGGNVSWLTSTDSDVTASFANMWSNYSLAVLSFVGCLLVVGIVLLVVKLGGKGGRSAIMLIICGQVVGAIMGAISNSIRYYYVYTDPYGVKADILTSLQIASFYRSYTWIDLIAVGIPLVLTFVIIMRLRRKMTLLAFSEDEARTMGVDTKRMRITVVLLCTLLTAILVSFCGRVGFVGFLVPHLARRLTGPSFSYLLPATTVLGGVFVLGAYTLLEITFGSSYETMVGMYISIAGAVVFLVTALRGGGGTRGQFE